MSGRTTLLDNGHVSKVLPLCIELKAGRRYRGSRFCPPMGEPLAAFARITSWCDLVSTLGNWRAT
jgi:hypothetical protein